MKTNASRDRRLLITKNSILMLVMLVVIFLAIWAWYLDPYTPVTAETTEITAAGTDDVELALPVKVAGDNNDYFPKSNTEWKNKIEFNETGYLKNLVKDVTSNGEQFVVPNFQAAAGLEKGRTVIPDDVWVEGLSSKLALTNTVANDDDQYNYISLEFYARSKVNAFSVTGGSYLAAGSELGKYVDSSGDIADGEAKPLKGSNIYRPSSYGAAAGTANAFSADAIIGAMRVSLQGAPVNSISGSGSAITPAYASGVSDTLRFVWLPRPDVFLKTDNNSDNWRLFTGIKPSSNSASGSVNAATINGYAKRTYAHTFYQGNYVSGNVKKGLTKKLYYDSNVKTGYSSDSDFNDCVISNPDLFKVTKITSSDTKVGTTGYTPKLNQSQSIAGNGTGDSSAPKTIQFTDDGSGRATTGYYVYKFTLNLWIEGEDAEARRSMNDGMFSLLMEFGTS